MRPWAMIRLRTSGRVFMTFSPFHLDFTNFSTNRNINPFKKLLLHFSPAARITAQELLNFGAQLHYADQRFRRKPHHLVAPTGQSLHELECLPDALLCSRFLTA